MEIFISGVDIWCYTYDSSDEIIKDALGNKKGEIKGEEGDIQKEG